MKNMYIVVTIEENKKYYCYVIKTKTTDNLLYKLKIKNIVSADIHETKKRAYQVTETRNNIYKLNNQYLFDETF